MPGLRLRWQDHEIAMPAGEFVIGRSHGCHLFIDDPRISRRHAVIRVDGGRLTIEDASGRAGVRVNGAFVRQPTPVIAGDQILIGSHEVSIVWRSGHESVTRPDPREHQLRASLATADQLTAPSPSLLDLAERAIARSEFDEASWVVGRLAIDTRGRLEDGEIVDALTLGRLSDLLVRLARATLEVGWLDTLLDLHEITGEPPESATIDAIEGFFRRERRGSEALRRCVRTLQKLAGRLDADETARLGRLEWLVENLPS